MSKATKRHCAGTVQSQGGRVRNVKQVSFEPGPEDGYGRCGSDKIRQTVLLQQTRAAATGKARSPTVDGRVRLTIDDEVDSVPAFRVKLGASDLNFVDV